MLEQPPSDLPPARSGPLAGIRLIELEAIGPVPLAAMILADLGADVIRIARPSAGHWGSIGAAVLFRGRTTVQLDLKSPDDRERLLNLAQHADGLIEGGRPGVTERLGIGPDVCLSRNPRLVYVRVTGWGQEGPLAQQAGHDITYLAMTGALHAIGDAQHPPSIPLNLIGDYAGGTMFAALGLVAALLQARVSGVGQVVDVAMVDGVAVLLSLYHELLAAGQWKDVRGTNFLDGAAPYYRCYACADGRHVAVGALEPAFFHLLVEGLGLSIDDYNQTDPAGWPKMQRDFAKVFAARPRDDWERIFSRTDACVAPVLSLAEAIRHPVNVARQTFTAHGGVDQASPAPRFSITTPAIVEQRSVSVEEALAHWAS